MGYIKAVGSHLSSRRRPWQATKDPAEQLATLMLLVPQSKGAVWPKDAKGCQREEMDRDIQEISGGLGKADSLNISGVTDPTVLHLLGQLTFPTQTR